MSVETDAVAALAARAQILQILAEDKWTAHTATLGDKWPPPNPDGNRQLRSGSLGGYCLTRRLDVGVGSAQPAVGDTERFLRTAHQYHRTDSPTECSSAKSQRDCNWIISAEIGDAATRPTWNR
jgi:hypothetical protein